MWSDEDDYISPYYFDSDNDSDDDHYFDDDDYYCGYSSGEGYSGLMLAARRVRAQNEDSDEASNAENSSAASNQVFSLQDLCCRFIALKFPFAFVEHRSPPIPDELQLKIIEFSFPEGEEMIRKYAEFSRSSVDFCSAKRLLENGNVKDLNQIGFRLSATVDDRRCSTGRSNDSGKNYVTILFDRGKITSAHCSCELSTNWCAHVVATCLARIKDTKAMTIRMPVSDSLNSLDREQLLKFAQYLLCEHQNERVVETAQQLLDKLLLRQQGAQQEEINTVAGAPDPTAGPGLDEEAHWFVCKSGFKSRCESLMYESHQDLGFVKYNEHDNDTGSSVNELWGRNCLQQAFVRDEMDIQLDNEYCGYSSSRRQSVLQVLETIADLLRDDFMSAVSALTMCTEQLIERLSKLCHGNSPVDRYRLSRSGKREPTKATKLCGSLAGGFTPRFLRTLSDELSRLWRLAVLSSGIPAKQRQSVIDQLRTFNETVSVTFVTGALRPWHGLEVAIRLSSIDWNCFDFQRVLKGEWVYIPHVSSCMAIQLTCQSKNTCLSEWMAMYQDKSDTNTEQGRPDDSVTPLSFYNPHCIALGPSFNTDIHSLCSMIEALDAGGEHQRAVRLTVAVSYALVSFCKSVLFGFCDVSSMPVSARCSLGTAAYKSAEAAEENGASDSPMEVETCSERSSTSHAWPEDTLLAISTFAFLFELLSQKFDLVGTAIAELKSKLECKGFAICDCLKSAVSLKFQLGVVGLCLQRLPAPSLHHEAEEYHYECWLTYQLIDCTPSDTDLSFLAQIGQQVPQRVATPNPVPPSSLCRVIFHHLFKGAPAALSKSLTEQQGIGLHAALSVLAHNNEHTVKDTPLPWMLFQYANCRLWAKLAEVVLRSLSDSPELLGEAMSCMLKPEGMLGAQHMERISADSVPLDVLSRLRDAELIAGKSRVAYCLARALSERQGNSIKITHFKRKTRDQSTRRESFELEMPRKIMKSGVDKALKLCSVQIAAQSLWLKKLLDRDYGRGDTVRWLTDSVVSSGIESLECLVKCRGDVTSFLGQSDLLELCERVLRKEPQREVQIIIQNILLSLLQKASKSQASDDMKRVVSFCREKRCASRLDLLPWICIGLQTLEDSNSFLPFEVLMDASHGMLEHYKQKLAVAETQIQLEWSQKEQLYLNRLFSEGTPAEDDSDNEEGDNSAVNKNPFRTPEAHPFLETAFTLGMIGLDRLREKPDELEHNRIPHYRIIRSCPVKEHLSEFCRLVCYLVNKKWLTEALKVAPGMKSPKRENKAPSSVAATPGCSHWEDAQSQSVSKISCDSCYLHKFVYSLINSVDNPLWLFEVLQELGVHLCTTDVPRSSPTSRQERQNLKMKQACQCYPPVKLLLQKDLDTFSKLLLGPKMTTVVDGVARRRDQRRLEPSEIVYELGHSKLINTRLQEVLQVAKRAFSISDSSGSTFKNLTEEIATEHPILRSLLDRVLKDEDTCSSSEREVIFPRASILPALFAQGLFPGLFERSHIDDYF